MGAPGSRPMSHRSALPSHGGEGAQNGKCFQKGVTSGRTEHIQNCFALSAWGLFQAMSQVTVSFAPGQT